MPPVDGDRERREVFDGPRACERPDVQSALALEMLDQIWSFVAETHHWVCNHAIDVDGDSATGLTDARYLNEKPKTRMPTLE